MATEIYNNFHLQKKSTLDDRLETVANVAALPDPNAAGTFIPEGAIIYVTDVKLNYQAQIVTGSTLAWYNIGGVVTSAKVQGSINILPTTTILDCSLVTPAIATCHSVVVNIVGGSSASITSVTNLPIALDDDDLITFYTGVSQSLTFVHTEYDVAGTNDIILEGGFDMTLIGRLIGDDSLTLKRHGAAVAQWSAVQYLKKGELNTNLLTALGVINNLTSISTVNPLSANQGRVLNEKISLKQDTLTTGSHIDITSNVISSTKWEWTTYAGTIPSHGAGNAVVVGLFGVPQAKYTWVDLRSNDRGLWLLPPELDPTIIGNWTQVDQPTNNAKSARYTIAGDATLTAVGTYYNPRILNGSYDGDNLGLSWNSDGPASEKVSFTLPEGTYQVKVKLNILSDKHNDFAFSLHTTNGLTTAAIGVPVTNVMRDIAYVSSPTTAWTDSAKDSYIVEGLIIVGGGVGVGVGVILGLSSASDFTNSSVDTTLSGYLEIIKIK